MNIFNKEKGKNRLLKLYKVVSQKQAEAFETKRLIEFILFEVDKYPIKLDTFYVTGPYLNSGWKTKNGFLKGLKKKHYKNIHHLILADSENKFYLSFSNFSHNRTIEVDSDSIDFNMMIDENILSEKELVLFGERVYPYLNFEYGYIFKQSKRLSIDEGKINNGLFGISESKSTKYNKWSTYNSAINHGYLRNLYQFNFLSKLHIENEPLKSVIKSMGKLEDKAEYYLWTLSILELEKALGVLKTSEYLIENVEFDKSHICNHINNEIKKYAPNVETKIKLEPS
jgi:hypothetical protein